MNWLGWNTAALAGALLGALLGAAAYAVALAHGWDAPFLVGLFTGAGAMLASTDKSGLRALLIATSTIWIAAAVQANVGPFASAGLAGFHTTLTAARLLGFVMCGSVAFLLARTSLRNGASRRQPGA